MARFGRWSALALGLACALALGLGETALAKQGRGRGRGGDDAAARVKEKVGLEIVDREDVAPRKARLRVRRDKGSRQELRIQLSDAASGRELDVWFEGSDGALTRVGAMRESSDHRGDYDWRVRTKKGQALPFGVSDVADLSGRAIEVREGADVVARGAMPQIAAAAAATGKRAAVSNPLASTAGSDDGTTAADDSPDFVKAEIRLRRKSDREELKVEVEHAAAGLDLSVWIADDADTLVEIGTLREQAGDDGTEYELTLRTDRDVLPFGLTSVAGLADRAIEIRDADGNVLAAGFVPRLGEPSGTTSGEDPETGDAGTAPGDDGAAETEAEDEAEVEDETEDEIEVEDETETEDETPDLG